MREIGYETEKSVPKIGVGGLGLFLRDDIISNSYVYKLNLFTEK